MLATVAKGRMQAHHLARHRAADAAVHAATVAQGRDLGD
jgi:hypothetical protein